MKKIAAWYRSQEGVKKWVIHFIVNWIYWGFIHVLTDFVLSEVNYTIRYFLISTTIMALMWTVLYDTVFRNWYTKKQKSEQKAEVSDTTKDEKDATVKLNK